MRDANEFPDNSHAGKARKKQEPVVTVPVHVRPEGFFSRMRSSFFSGSGGSIGNDLIFEVLVPAAKSMLMDALTQGLQKTFYGNSQPSGRSYSPTSSGYVSYNNYYAPSQQQQAAPPQRAQTRRSDTVSNVDFPERADAIRVLEQLQELVGVYGMTSVADYYDLVGLKSEITDEQWGWYSLNGVYPQRLPGARGFVLNLPRPRPLT